MSPVGWGGQWVAANACLDGGWRPIQLVKMLVHSGKRGWDAGRGLRSLKNVSLPYRSGTGDLELRSAGQHPGLIPGGWGAPAAPTLPPEGPDLLLHQTAEHLG